MRLIPYSLTSENKTSDLYYNHISRFTDSVIEVLKDIPVEKIIGFVQKGDIEEPRKKEEYLLDLLMMGVLLRVYGRKARLVGNVSKENLKRVARLRSIKPSQRPVLDKIKGNLSTRVLAMDPETEFETVDPSLENIHYLIDYLEATGEFEEECIRLNLWNIFLRSLDLDEASNWIRIALSTAEWFEYKSINALGIYTQYVTDYLKSGFKDHLFREDVFFCGRRRVEYHLNMVGAEVMNRSFKEDFDKKPLKVVFLPTCMSAMGAKCKAVKREMGIQCKGCTSSCIVNKLNKMGEEKGFMVIMAAHGSSIMKDPSLIGNIGVVGVACILNLLSSGWKARRMGVPAQCVLLDQCGCKNHWDDNGIPTMLNISQFKKKIGGL